MQWTRVARPSGAMRAALRRLSSSLPEHREVTMPKVSPTMTAGRLITWKKREGDAFAEGEDIADVESDKATMPISAREDGFMARILVDDDTPDLPLGTLLAITVEEEEYLAAFKDYQPSAADPAPTPTVPPAASAPTPAPAPAPATASPVLQTPAAPVKVYSGPIGPAIMRLLNEFPNMNLNAITPTGPKGHMLKGDVLAAIADGTAFNRPAVSPSASPAASPSAPAAPAEGLAPTEYTDVPVSSMRRAIARRLVESKTTVPHRYAASKYELDALLALRKRLNAVEPSPKISVNDFVIRAVGIALRRVPEMNAAWDDVAKEAVRNATVDVSMAVAIPGGLITPIVTNVDSKGLAEIAGVTKDLVTRAREGSLAPEEFEGGSFSISNLGMFGISSFSAIINPPQSGILAVGSGIQRAVMSEDGTMKTVTEGMATLSTDARVVEEETAAKFLREFTSCLTNPENMLA